MDIKFNKVDDLNATIKVSLVKDDYQPNVDKALKDYRKKAVLPGFRPGNVPMNLIKMKYEVPVKAEEINKTLSRGLFDYLKDNNIDYMGEPLPSLTEKPEGDFEKDSDFSFTFDIALAPQFQIAIDNALNVPKYTITVADKDVDKTFENYKNAAGKNEPAEVSEEKSILKGEVYQVDDNGEKLAEGLSNTTSMLVSNVKDEKERAKFIGKKVGDKICFDLKQVFPNEAEAKAILNNNMLDFNTVNANFAFSITEILTFVPGELNQDVFDRFFGKDKVHNEEEMRAEIISQYKANYENESDYRLFVDAKAELLKKADFAVPMEFMKRWLLSLEQYKDFDKEKLETSFPSMEEDIKWNLIENHLVKDNKIEITEDDELAEEKEVMKAEFARYGLPVGSIPDDTLDGYAKERLAKDEERRRIRPIVINNKLTKIIKEKATLNNKEISYEDFVKLFESEK